MKIATYNVNGINARLPVLLHWLARVEAGRRLPAGAQGAGREVPHRRHPRGGLRGRLARPEGLERRRHPRPGRGAAGDPPRPARRPGRHPQPLHRGRRGRHHRRLPVPAQRQPRPGPEVRLQAEMVRAASTATPRTLLEEGGPVVLAGDYNVIPTERDAYKPERWVDDALFLPESREAYRQLLAQGWTDALRHSAPGGDDLHLLGLLPERLRPQRGHPHRPPAPEPGRLPRA